MKKKTLQALIISVALLSTTAFASTDYYCPQTITVNCKTSEPSSCALQTSITKIKGLTIAGVEGGTIKPNFAYNNLQFNQAANWSSALCYYSDNNDSITFRLDNFFSKNAQNLVADTTAKGNKWFENNFCTLVSKNLSCPYKKKPSS